MKITVVWILLHSYHPLPPNVDAGGLVMEEYLGTPFSTQEECEIAGAHIIELDRTYFPEEADYTRSTFTCYPQSAEYTRRLLEMKESF